MDYIKKHKSVVIGILVGLVLGFFGGYEYRTKEIKDAVNEAFSTVSESFDSSFNSTSSEDEDVSLEYKTHAVGELVNFATQDMKLNSAVAKNSVSAPYGSPLVASEGTKYIVVNHTVTNTTDSPFMYTEFVLWDSENKQYNYDSDATFNIENYLSVRELSPDVPETGVIVFKVPESTNSFRFGALKGSSNTVEVVDFSL
ncbi:MAG: DUF4352 domain-containing protein [Candidatus Saccharibacteria bacterium]|nr:DUF4352 domain-containing protein [Candidatus Saccharibacteria bacterium]